MKKTLKPILLVVAIALATMLSVIPARGVIEDRTWLGSMIDWGTDPYYGVAVYGYKQGQTALLSVEINNNLVIPMNISEVAVNMDWTTSNYTNTLSPPLQLKAGETRFVPITFTVPNTTIASNRYLHGYTIYVNHVNATGALAGTMQLAFTSDPRFAVYSDEQYDAREISRILSSMPMPLFNSTAAKLSWSKSTNETSIAAILYEQGDFAGARDHYTTALAYRNAAFTTENEITGGIQSAELDLAKAQAKSFEAQANYLNGLSSMWILIGVAAVLFAIGYIIRGLGALRKPPTATK